MDTERFNHILILTSISFRAYLAMQLEYVNLACEWAKYFKSTALN